MADDTALTAQLLDLYHNAGEIAMEALNLHEGPTRRLLADLVEQGATTRVMVDLGTGEAVVYLTAPNGGADPVEVARVRLNVEGPC